MEVSQEQLKHARFWRKLLRLSRGRVAVLRALEVIALEEKDAGFKGIVSDIHDRMEDGAILSEALAEHAAVFSLSVREMIKTAEKCGAWDEILLEIAQGLEEGTFD